MADKIEYGIVETHTGWAVKRREITLHGNHSHSMLHLQSEHSTKEEAQAEADRLNSNQ